MFLHRFSYTIAVFQECYRWLEKWRLFLNKALAAELLLNMRTFDRIKLTWGVFQSSCQNLRHFFFIPSSSSF